MSGTINVYASDQCEAAGSSTQGIGADGYVYTALGEAAAKAMCAAAHADGREYSVQQQALNLNLYLCVGVVPTATNTAIPPSKYAGSADKYPGSADEYADPADEHDCPADAVGSAGDSGGAAV